MLRAYKYRLLPNSEQAKLLSKHFGCVRHVYNWALAQRQSHYKRTGETLSMRQFFDALVVSKKTDRPWLADVNSQSLQSALRHLDDAYKNFFEKRSGFPRFKSKYAGWQSFQCPQHVRVDFENNRISLPKIPGMRAFLHREFDLEKCVIKTVTIKRSPSGKYTASVLVDDGSDLPAVHPIQPEKTVGLDVGITHYLVDSDGRKTDNPKHLKVALRRLAVEQRKLSRKRRGSNNRHKQKRVVARVHERVANKRNDFIHQLTAKLVDKNHATGFAVEDLNVKGMIRNRTLARTIADCAWSRFVEILRYKCDGSGKYLLEIDRFAPSSKTCSGCGYRMTILPLSVRQWSCPACRAEHDRDINAAVNIKQFALADALGQSVCVKSPPVTPHVSACVTAKGDDSFHRLGSQEAPAITGTV